LSTIVVARSYSTCLRGQAVTRTLGITEIAMDIKEIVKENMVAFAKYRQGVAY
jgi:hypothetical protein